jgi:hypothetical protein
MSRIRYPTLYTKSLWNHTEERRKVEEYVARESASFMEGDLIELVKFIRPYMGEIEQYIWRIGEEYPGGPSMFELWKIRDETDEEMKTRVSSEKSDRKNAWQALQKEFGGKNK